mmetsp:Transcript_51074/g.101143  ORF Transcript_51074/g.101143 Transcript_51074/m.101143 type:complete len:205 (+) Transcript_51074:145-759(+)
MAATTARKTCAGSRAPAQTGKAPATQTCWPTAKRGGAGKPCCPSSPSATQATCWAKAKAATTTGGTLWRTGKGSAALGRSRASGTRVWAATTGRPETTGASKKTAVCSAALAGGRPFGAPATPQLSPRTAPPPLPPTSLRQGPPTSRPPLTSPRRRPQRKSRPLNSFLPLPPLPPLPPLKRQPKKRARLLLTTRRRHQMKSTET